MSFKQTQNIFNIPKRIWKRMDTCICITEITFKFYIPRVAKNWAWLKQLNTFMHAQTCVFRSLEISGSMKCLLWRWIYFKRRLFLSFPRGERGQAGGSKLSGKTSLPWTCWLSASVGCPHWLTSVAMVASWLWWWESCSNCFSSSFCFRQIWWSLWSASSSSS